MKMTTNLSKTLRIVTFPIPEAGQVQIDTECLLATSGEWFQLSSVKVSPDQGGSVIFGIEQAFETLEANAQRVACKGDGVCTVPEACTTPTACGVNG